MPLSVHVFVTPVTAHVIKIFALQNKLQHLARKLTTLKSFDLIIKYNHKQIHGVTFLHRVKSTQKVSLFKCLVCFYDIDSLLADYLFMIEQSVDVV